MVEETKSEETGEDYVIGQVYRVLVNDLKPGPYQPRKFFDTGSLAHLASSIKEYGLQQPIVVVKAENGLVIAAGERRLRAAKLAGLEKVSIIITDKDPQKIGLIENLLRDDLTPIERAEALERLMEDEEYSQQEVASFIGKSESIVSEILSLNKLTPEIRGECRNDPSIPLRELIRIARRSNDEEMLRAFTEYKENRKRVKKIPRKRKSWHEMFNSRCADLMAIESKATGELLDDATVTRYQEEWKKTKEHGDKLLRDLGFNQVRRGSLRREEPSEQRTAAD